METNSAPAQRLPGLTGQLLVVGILSFFLNVLLLTGSIYMIQIFDRVLSAGRIETLVFLTLIAGLALGVYGALEALRGRMLSRLAGWVEARLSPPILHASRMIALRGHDTGTRGLADLGQMRSFLGGNGINALFDAPWLPCFVVVIWLLHPWLGMLAVAGAGLLFGLAFANEWLTRGALEHGRTATGRSREAAEGMIRNAESVQALGMGATLMGQWRALHAAAASAQGTAEERTAVLLGASKSARQLLQVVVMGTGAWLVLRDELTGGGMIAASILLGRALAPVEQAIGAWRQFASARAGWRSVRRLLDAVPAEQARTALPAPRGLLTAEQVAYRRRPAESPILHRVSFELQPGNLCAILGPSGSGKSSLCRLLVGAWHASHGTVRLDGADIARWQPDDLGRHIGYVPQGVELFAGTVARNIARLGDAPSDRIVEAARRAGAHEMILRLPDGYDTDIGRFGERLSAGQRQRIALARALFGEPRLLVLDEPNANLDAESEETLARSLDALKAEGCTTVVVTHRTGLLRIADRVGVMERGTMRLFGPRDAVLAKLSAPGSVTPIRPAARAVAGPDPAARG